MQESADEKERAQEWLEMVALERRHQKLAKQKELYRLTSYNTLYSTLSLLDIAKH